MGFSYRSLPWLLEEDKSGIRYVTLKDVVGLARDNSQLISAKQVAYTSGFIGNILKHMNPEGYWSKEGAGYSPKYRSTVWALILLSQLGASVKDSDQIRKACTYYLDHALSSDDSIAYNGRPAGTIDCLQGNMCAALTDLGYEDERLDRTYEWMARSVIGDGVKYYAYKCGPVFACGANSKQSCAWGAVKVLLALSKVPPFRRNTIITKAIETGVEFILGIDPMTAAYPTVNNTKPNRTWWQFGFPTFYNTDLLQLIEALVSLGYGNDPRLQPSLDFIMSKQDCDGRWNLEHDYQGKTWGNFGVKGKPNKWVTYRVVRILKMLTII